MHARRKSAESRTGDKTSPANAVLLIGVPALLIFAACGTFFTVDGLGSPRAPRPISGPSATVASPAPVDPAGPIEPGLIDQSIKPGPTELPDYAPRPAQTPPAENPISAPDPSAGYRQVDDQVQGLLKRDAIWHTPEHLNQGQTGNVALTVGNAGSLQTLINTTVPGSQTGTPIPVTITPSVRAKLSVVGDDAAISPLDAIDQSIGEQTAMFFSWVVIPHRPGQLKMQALLECTMTDGRIITQIVPLSINVEPATTSWTSRFADLIRNFWTQLAAAGAGLLAAARFVWSWYKRRRSTPPGATAAEPPKDNTTEPSPPAVSQETIPTPPPSPAPT